MLEKVLLQPPDWVPFVVFGSENRFTELKRQGWKEPEEPSSPEEPTEQLDPEDPPVVETAVDPNLINVNTAAIAELTDLPSIGIAKATAIVSGRPYSELADLIALDLTGVDWLSLESLITF